MITKLKSFLYGIDTPSLAPSPDHIPFEEQLVWAMWLNRSDIFDTVDAIYHHYEYMSMYTQYLLNKQYLCEYNGSNLLTVHIVDDQFAYESDRCLRISSTYGAWCYPEVITSGKVIIDGPWIDKLRKLFIEKNVKQRMLQERAEKQRQKELEEQQKQHHQECCKMKRNNILKDFK